MVNVKIFNKIVNTVKFIMTLSSQKALWEQIRRMEQVYMKKYEEFERNLLTRLEQVAKDVDNDHNEIHNEVRQLL